MKLNDIRRPLLALVTGLAALLAAAPAAAVPAFARQTGMACVACHYQTFPAINAFGRAFKAAGYTLVGAQEQLKGDDLSLPMTLNASLVTKLRYQKTNGPDDTIATNTGELQFPDEAALLIGGRVGSHIGFVLEFATFGEADTGSGEFSLFGSYKMPFTYKLGATDLLFVPFSTDAGGAGYGFELLNTGAQRFQRVGEDRNALMAQQYLGLGAGEATGFTFAAAHSMGFVNLSLWAPKHGSFAVKKLAPYFRAAWTPSVGGWDAGLGVQVYSGSAKENDGGTLVEHVTKGWALDGQLQGDLGRMPVGLYAAFGRTPANPDSVFNNSATDRRAWSVHGQLGVLPGKATLLVGYRSADRGTPTRNRDNALTLGGTFMLAQNVQLQLNHVIFGGNRYDAPKPGGGDQRTTLMLFAAM